MRTFLHDHATMLIGAPIVGIGVVLIVFQDLWLGIALGVIGNQFAMSDLVVGVVRRVHEPARAMYQRGFDIGKNVGYAEGRRSARPVVIPLVRDDAREDQSV